MVGESLAAYWERLANNAPAFMIELKKLIGPATDIAVASGAPDLRQVVERQGGWRRWLEMWGNYFGAFRTIVLNGDAKSIR